jgi:hypothetical protein
MPAKPSKFNFFADLRQGRYVSGVENGAHGFRAGQKLGIVLVNPASSGECRCNFLNSIAPM